jgi:hypothetical protein
MSDSIQQQALPKHISRVIRRGSAALEFIQVHLVPAQSNSEAWSDDHPLSVGLGEGADLRNRLQEKQARGQSNQSLGTATQRLGRGESSGDKVMAGYRSWAYRVQFGVKLCPRLAYAVARKRSWSNSFRRLSMKYTARPSL